MCFIFGFFNPKCLIARLTFGGLNRHELRLLRVMSGVVLVDFGVFVGKWSRFAVSVVKSRKRVFMRGCGGLWWWEKK